MHKMAEAFNTNVKDLEDELMQLVLEGQINARIDSHNKVSNQTIINETCFFSLRKSRLSKDPLHCHRSQVDSGARVAAHDRILSMG